KAILKYVLSPMAIIDLLAILPFYLELTLVAYGIHHMADTRFLRVLRLMRLLRLFKLNRYNSSMKMIGNVLREEKEKLFITLFMVVILLVLSAALIFTFEHEAQPEAFPNIYSSMWWAIATLTTVGYGDVFPVTAIGKMLAGFIALLGIGLVALPTGILASSFVTHLDENEDEEENPEESLAVQHKALAGKGFKYCPHCGEKLEQHEHKDV
ncbi:MAG: potassium channel family protein, partial [Phaeodactylibacter sp.]|nr:potassium channel family protein [Phaeodactylibacter sp.]